ncbi:MAG: hypothetical protein KDD75_09120 [Caldilineaceae bacterium]|nr:hypothetical protein [Caldilineaceae bacterium]
MTYNAISMTPYMVDGIDDVISNIQEIPTWTATLDGQWVPAKSAPSVEITPKNDDDLGIIADAMMRAMEARRPVSFEYSNRTFSFVPLAVEIIHEDRLFVRVEFDPDQASHTTND